jgi:uncharacterized protein YndB with AHSA1/START domain
LRPFRFDRILVFDVGADQLWATLTRTDDFCRWWPWLREFSGDGLVPGGRSKFVVRAPVPYALRFAVTVSELVPGRLVALVVDGDLVGTARLEVDPDHEDGGSAVRVAWELELGRPMLRTAGWFGRPIMEWGHNWVVTNGIEQFRRRALRVDVAYDDHDDDRGSGAA